MSRNRNVMDVLNLWKDDPEEILLELGFGCDEPDLSGRIPARFINCQSKARGINLQVFLDAQKNRIDLENPDVSNRFRELEVLQQVTTTFCALVVSSSSSFSSSSSSLRAPVEKTLSPDARERRRRMASLFRRASKKSLGQTHSHKTQDLTSPTSTSTPSASPTTLQPKLSLGDENRPLPRGEPANVCPNPMADEQGDYPNLPHQPDKGLAKELRLGHLWKEDLLTVNASQQRKGEQDDTSLDRKENLTGGHQRSEIPDSSPPFDFSFSLLPPSLISPSNETSSNSDQPCSQVEKPSAQVHLLPTSMSESANEQINPHSSLSELQNGTESQPPNNFPPPSYMQIVASLNQGSENIASECMEVSWLQSLVFQNSSDIICSTLSLSSDILPPSPTSDSKNSIIGSSTKCDSSFERPEKTLSERTVVDLHENSPSLSDVPSTPHSISKGFPHRDYLQAPTFVYPHLTEPLSHIPENNVLEFTFTHDSGLSEENKDKDKGVPLPSPPLIQDNFKFEDNCSALSNLNHETVVAHGSGLSEKSTNLSFQVDNNISSALSPALELKAVQITQSISHERVLSQESCISEIPTNPPVQLVSDVSSSPPPVDLELKAVQNMNVWDLSKSENDCLPLPCLSFEIVFSHGSGLAENPTNPILDLDRDVPSAPTHAVQSVQSRNALDSSKFEDDFPALSYISREGVLTHESGLSEIPTNPSLQLVKDVPSALLTPDVELGAVQNRNVLDVSRSGKFEDDFPALSYISREIVLSHGSGTNPSLYLDKGVPSAPPCPVPELKSGWDRDGLDSCKCDDCPALSHLYSDSVLFHKSGPEEGPSNPSLQLGKDVPSALPHLDLELREIQNRHVWDSSKCEEDCPASPCLSRENVLSHESGLAENPSNPSLQMDRDFPSSPPLHVLEGNPPIVESFKFEDDSLAVSHNAALSHGSGLLANSTNLPIPQLDMDISGAALSDLELQGVLNRRIPKLDPHMFEYDWPSPSYLSLQTVDTSDSLSEKSPYVSTEFYNDTPQATYFSTTPVFTPTPGLSEEPFSCKTVLSHGISLSEISARPSHLDKGILSPLPTPVQNSTKFEDDCPTEPCLSHDTVSLQSHPDLHLKEEAAKLAEHHITINDTLPFHVQDDFHEHENLQLVDLYHSTKRDINGEVVLYISDKDSSAQGPGLFPEEPYNQLGKDPLVFCWKSDEHSADIKPEELQKLIDTPVRNDSLINELLVLHQKTDMATKGLMESSDQVFDTSVDGIESENEDMDLFFQQLDNEGRVYWAEPILVSDSSYLLEDSESFGALVESPGDSLLSRGSVSLDSISSPPKIDIQQTNSDPSSAPIPTQVQSQPTTPDLKLSSRSVSVQMSSSLSSHIVHRKDVPYVAVSEHSTLPSVFPLDTSSPFRAVQAWTDMQIRRNRKKLTQRALTLPREAATHTGAEMTHRSTMIYASAPSFPLLSKDSQSQVCLNDIATNYRTVSVSVDTGLGPDKEEEMYRNTRNERERHLWEGKRSFSVACCCSCDHHCSCCARECYSKQHTLEHTPYSLGDLEEMMLWLQQYCSVHTNMEEQLSENRATVYSCLSDMDREKIEDLEALRRAVKQEAVELETQLNQLAHHRDDSLKMKMRRLLDEQSLLCSQLRVRPPAAAAAASSSSSAPSRTVSTLQACGQSDQSPCENTENTDSPKHPSPGVHEDMDMSHMYKT